MAFTFRYNIAYLVNPLKDIETGKMLYWYNNAIETKRIRQAHENE